MFGMFKRKNFSDTATEICVEYRNHIAMGKLPKEALVWAMGLAMKQHRDLKEMSVAAYCTSIFGARFTNMPDDNTEAEEFVCDAITNIIGAYLHPECNSMKYMNDFSGDNPSVHLENIVLSKIKFG